MNVYAHLLPTTQENNTNKKLAEKHYGLLLVLIRRLWVRVAFAEKLECMVVFSQTIESSVCQWLRAGVLQPHYLGPILPMLQ